MVNKAAMYKMGDSYKLDLKMPRDYKVEQL